MSSVTGIVGVRVGILVTIGSSELSSLLDPWLYFDIITTILTDTIPMAMFCITVL